MDRYLKQRYPWRTTLLTNDYNLAMKAQANDIVALSSTSPTGEALSSDLLIRQAIHGPLPLENTFFRPKEGDDIAMFDLSGTVDDHIKFLPGLEASQYAPKSRRDKSPREESERETQIAIDPETGKVVLVKIGERPPVGKGGYAELERLIDSQGRTDGMNGVGVGIDGKTYADIMALDQSHSKHLSDDEMEWE
jgi:hypothetical protein